MISVISPSVPRRIRDIAAVALVLAAACSSGSRVSDVVDAGTDLAAPAPDVVPDSFDVGPDATDLAPSRDEGPPPVDLRGPDAVDGQLPLEFPPPGRQRLRGHLIFGNERMAFYTCGSTALIWANLQGGEPGLDKLNGLTPPCTPDAGFCPARPIYVELDAWVSGPCQCGHLGQYQRELRIHELFTASATSPADCP